MRISLTPVLSDDDPGYPRPPMPKSKSLHGSTPDSSKVVLLLVDLINDLEFDGGEKLLPCAREMAKPLATLIRRARRARVPIIYANDNWGRWRSSFEQTVTACRNTRGWPVVKQLLPKKNDYFVLKAKHSAFYATPLHLLLQHLDAETLIIAGLAADNCVLFTAGDAYMLEYDVVIPRDCVASEDDERLERALEHMKLVLKAKVVASSKVKLRA